MRKKMIRSFVIVLVAVAPEWRSTTLAAASTTGNDEQCRDQYSSLLACPENEQCTEWSDGCNDCSCDGGCTEMYCRCYDEGNCVPSCRDNDACTPLADAGPDEDAVEDASDGETSAPSIFRCPLGQSCGEWYDGCNECQRMEDGGAACTRMYCECYADDSCVPKCRDNADCEPATATLPATIEAKAALDSSNAVAAAAAFVNECVKESYVFECPENTVCRVWNDGCNACSCGGEGNGALTCDDAYCDCDENGDGEGCAAPFCVDNDACTLRRREDDEVESDEVESDEVESDSASADVVVKKKEDGDVSVETDEIVEAAAPFVCPEGESCTEWFDGCNQCSSMKDSDSHALCTKKYCACYRDNSCRPVCNDNKNCVSANSSGGGVDSAKLASTATTLAVTSVLLL